MTQFTFEMETYAKAPYADIFAGLVGLRSTVTLSVTYNHDLLNKPITAGDTGVVVGFVESVRGKKVVCRVTDPELVNGLGTVGVRVSAVYTTRVDVDKDSEVYGVNLDVDHFKVDHEGDAPVTFLVDKMHVSKAVRVFIQPYLTTRNPHLDVEWREFEYPASMTPDEVKRFAQKITDYVETQVRAGRVFVSHVYTNDVLWCISLGTQPGFVKPKGPGLADLIFEE